MVESKASASLHCFSFIYPKGLNSPTGLSDWSVREHQFAMAGRIMDIDHGSRTSVVSRLSGPGQVGEI